MSLERMKLLKRPQQLQILINKHVMYYSHGCLQSFTQKISLSFRNFLLIFLMNIFPVTISQVNLPATKAHRHFQWGKLIGKNKSGKAFFKDMRCKDRKLTPHEILKLRLKLIHLYLNQRTITLKGHLLIFLYFPIVIPWCREKQFSEISILESLTWSKNKC